MFHQYQVLDKLLQWTKIFRQAYMPDKYLSKCNNNNYYYNISYKLHLRTSSQTFLEMERD